MPKRDKAQPITYSGPLASVFAGLVAEKQGAGYRYEATARDLLQLDRFCVTAGHREVTLPRELVLRWTAKQPHEAETTRQQRISLIRITAEYMRRHGYPADVYPLRTDARNSSHYVPHIFTHGELARLFAAIDASQPDSSAPQRHRVPPIIRLMLPTRVWVVSAG